MEKVEGAVDDRASTDDAVTDRAFSDSPSQEAIKTVTVSPNDVGSLLVRDSANSTAKVV